MIVKGKVTYASVQKPNTRYTPRWEINVYPSDEDVKKLEDAGVNVREDKETGESFIKASQNVARKDGTENDPPRVVDAAKNPFDKLIGNGSICNVKFALWEYDSFGSKGVKPILEAVQVIKHVPYDGDEDFEVEESEDF